MEREVLDHMMQSLRLDGSCRAELRYCHGTRIHQQSGIISKMGRAKPN